jgi:hypothetical protein
VKRKTHKLTLSKETLRALDAKGLQAAAAGAGTAWSCDPSCQSFCPSCDLCATMGYDCG